MDILPSQNAGIKGVFFDAMTLMKKMVAASVHPSKVKNLRFWSYLLRKLYLHKCLVLLHFTGSKTFSSGTIFFEPA